jgi:hypothetical protein
MGSRALILASINGSYKVHPDMGAAELSSSGNLRNQSSYNLV